MFAKKTSASDTGVKYSRACLSVSHPRLACKLTSTSLFPLRTRRKEQRKKRGPKSSTTSRCVRTEQSGVTMSLPFFIFSPSCSLHSHSLTPFRFGREWRRLPSLSFNYEATDARKRDELVRLLLRFYFQGSLAFFLFIYRESSLVSFDNRRNKWTIYSILCARFFPLDLHLSCDACPFLMLRSNILASQRDAIKVFSLLPPLISHDEWIKEERFRKQQIIPIQWPSKK